MSCNSRPLLIKSKKYSQKRLLSLDPVRGLAVIGMFIQHFALNERNSFVSGNTIILFMLCSGISYTIMTDGMTGRGIADSAVYTRILVRSVFIDLIGYVLLMLNGPFGMVLPAYAMLFLIAIPLTKLSRKHLLIFTSVSFLVCPVIMQIGLSLFANAAVLADIAGGPLSAAAWLPVFAAGMLAGRYTLTEKHIWKKFMVLGTSILIPAKLFALTVLPRISAIVVNWMIEHPGSTDIDEYAVWPHNTMPIQWHMLFVDAPQGGSAFELLIGLGGSLFVLGVFCLIEKKAKCILMPFCAAGRIALSLYAAQFVFAWVVALLGGDVTAWNLGSVFGADLLLGISILVLSVLITRVGKGPLEFLMRKFEQLFSA